MRSTVVAIRRAVRQYRSPYGVSCFHFIKGHRYHKPGHRPHATAHWEPLCSYKNGLLVIWAIPGVHSWYCRRCDPCYVTQCLACPIFDVPLSTVGFGRPEQASPLEPRLSISETNSTKLQSLHQSSSLAKCVHRL